MKEKTTTSMMLTLLLVSLLSLTLNIHLAKTEPATITVPDDYPTIQEAINAANPGDTIHVKSGIYFENVIVNKTVTLTGEDGNNTIIDGGGFGTVIRVTANNVSISKFTIRNSGNASPDSGIFIDYGATGSNISHNIITNNRYGIRMLDSSNNILSSNSLAGNRYNLGIWGSTLSHFIHEIDTSNLVDGKSVYYWVNQHEAEVPLDAGYVALVNCTEITVRNLTLTNNGQAILIAYTENSSITNNNITDNWSGILLFHSSNNVLSRNYIANSRYGIELEGSLNNVIYHNKLINNTNQITNLESINSWDDGYPSGGNYWSDYTGVDVKSGPNQDQPGSDGIGDTPYIIDENNTDRYPLMNPNTIHEIAITNITPSKTVIGQGFKFSIDIQAVNKGNRLETVNITVYANSTPIAAQTVNLTIGTTTITFTINTTGWTKGNYTINAHAWPVPGETNTEDNTLTYNGIIIITVPGDTDGDRDIDIYDIVRLASIYGAKRGEPRFNPNCDIDGNGEINIYDVVIAASHYGYKEP